MQSSLGTNFKDRDLKKVGKQNMAEFLHDQARKFIQSVDLNEGYHSSMKNLGFEVWLVGLPISLV